MTTYVTLSTISADDFDAMSDEDRQGVVTIEPGTFPVLMTLPDSIKVEKRDGATVDIDLSDIPETLFADFTVEGVGEYVRDSSSAALSVAFDVAHPDHKLEGDKLKAARTAWAGKDGNVFKIAEQSLALMRDAVERLYKGERRKVTPTGPAFTSHNDAAYDEAAKVKGLPGAESIAALFDKATGMATAERKRLVIDGIAALDDAHPFKVHINAAADRTVAERAALLALVTAPKPTK